jgi:hypothetical protein
MIILVKIKAQDIDLAKKVKKLFLHYPKCLSLKTCHQYSLILNELLR